MPESVGGIGVNHLYTSVRPDRSGLHGGRTVAGGGIRQL